MNVSDLTIDQLMALIAERQKIDAQEAADDPKKKKSSSAFCPRQMQKLLRKYDSPTFPNAQDAASASKDAELPSEGKLTKDIRRQEQKYPAT